MKKFNLFKEIIIADKTAVMQAVNSTRTFAITHDGRVVYEPFASTDIFIFQGKMTPQTTSALMPQQPKTLTELMGFKYKIVEDDDRVLIKAGGAWQDLIGINLENSDYDDTTGDGIDKFADDTLEEIGWQATEFNIPYRDIVEQIEKKCEGILFCIESEGDNYQFSGLGFIADMESARSIAFEYCKSLVEKELREDKDFSPDLFTDDEKESKAVIEEFLIGKELSILAVTDGKVIKPFPPSRDHKQLNDGNKGPMTGGMGAYCPVPGIDDNTYNQIKEKIIERTLLGLKKDKIDYRGVIYFGLMLTDDGPKVLEYNCRFGDPETQVVLSQLKTPLHRIIEAVKNQTLESLEIVSKKGFSACVVLASKGYPKKPETGMVIQGLEYSKKDVHSKIFFAGVKEQSGRLVTSGGRVLACISSGRTLRQALGRAYRLTSKIKFEGRQYRCDIGGRYARGRTSMLNFRVKVRRRSSS